MPLTIKFEGGKQSGLIQLMENQRSSQRHSKTKKSLEETHVNPDLYPNVVTIITTFLTMPVSTATHERSFSTMNRVKAYLRFTMKTEWLAALALMRAYKDISIDAKAVIRESSPKKQTSSFRISLSSTKISDMFAPNVSLVRSLRCCFWPQLQLAAFC